LNGLAFALANAGRADEAGAPLQEAQGMVKELKDDSLQAKLSLTRGDVARYQGDLKAADAAYEQAAALAAKNKDKERAMLAKMDLARVALSQGKAQVAITGFRAAVQQAESIHSTYYAISGTVDLGAALLSAKDYAHAREELDRVLIRSEKMGLRLETARIHYLIAKLLTQTGKTSEAGTQYQQTRNILADIMKEAGAEKLLQRPDLKAMYDDATRGSQSSKT